MGTNFYVKIPFSETVTVDTPAGPFEFNPHYAIVSMHNELHIGKSSSAGTYCYDCNLTLCKDGESRIHYSNSGWYDDCPKCHAKFNKNKDGNVGSPITGIGHVCSFSWAIEPSAVRNWCGDNMNKEIIEDENGESYTGRSFLAMFSYCKIESTRLVGERFQ